MENNFTPRYECPNDLNKYYFNDDYNIYEAAGYGMPNCTAYAYGRAYEILGEKPNLCPYGAGQWYEYNKNYNYYDYGQTPRVGAIACWNYDGGGHVAIVESIDENGDMILSNSAWNNYDLFFYLIYANKNDSNPGGSSWWNFQGYIYLIPENNTEEEQILNTYYQYKVINTQTLYIRTGPSIKYHAVDFYTKGDTFFIDKIQNNFGHILNTNPSLWTCLDYCIHINKKGDVNQDSFITIQDVTELQRYLAEIITLTNSQKINADFDQNNIITIDDATKIQRLLAEF